MRIKDLNGLYWLNKDIERRQERIKELEAEAERVTTFLSTLPKSKGFKDRLSQIVANIIDEKMIILLKTEELSIERRKIEYFLNDVKDPKMAYYMRLRFIDGMTWQQIANKCGNEATEDCARKSIERYLAGGEKWENGKNS